MTHFKVGDRVVINPSARYCPGFSSNMHQYIGKETTIARVHPLYVRLTIDRGHYVYDFAWLTKIDSCELLTREENERILKLNRDV